MTPDEARKDCRVCGELGCPCRYHLGYEDGYEAAQRERGPIQAVGKPRSANGLYYGGDAGMPRHFASETLTPEIEAECQSLGDPLEGGEEDVRVVGDSFLKARKTYNCGYCWGLIEPGERHRCIKAVVDSDQFGSVRYCAECCIAYAEQGRGDDGALKRFLDRYLMFLQARQQATQ